MPAKLSAEYGAVELSIEPKEKRGLLRRLMGRSSGIYFTDHSPEFDLVVRNPTDSRITNESQDKRAMSYFIAIGTGSPEFSQGGSVKFDLEPKSEKRIHIGDKTLGFEGNGMVAVRAGHSETELSKSETTLVPKNFPIDDEMCKILYTFSVWDRASYKQIHTRPTQLSWMVVILAIVQIMFVATQLYTTTCGGSGPLWPCLQSLLPI